MRRRCDRSVRGFRPMPASGCTPCSPPTVIRSWSSTSAGRRRRGRSRLMRGPDTRVPSPGARSRATSGASWCPTGPIAAAARAMPSDRELALCIAGATGWTGRAIVQGVLDAPDLALGTAVARSCAGQDLGEALGREPLDVRVHGEVAGALDGIDVLIDFTSMTVAKANALSA